MAHYACDCWDAELLTSYGWIECVGCADRSAFDLTVHSKFTGTPLVVKEALPEPIEVTEWQAKLDKKLLGLRFRRDAKPVQESVDALDQASLKELVAKLEETGVATIKTPALADGRTSVEISSDILSISRVTRSVNTREYTPNVIEPSFGIGRIMYSLLEHVYWHRPGDAARAVSTAPQISLYDYEAGLLSQFLKVLSLPLSVAPTKVLVVPLSGQPQFLPRTQKLSARFRSLGISNNIDSSTASIGKRYARNDELGTPLGITVDFETFTDGSITLRERDTMAQVRGSEDDVVQAVKNLVDGVESWEQVRQRLPSFTGPTQDD